MTAPISGAPLSVSSVDFFRQTMHFQQAGNRWVEKWDMAAYGGDKPMQALAARGRDLANARRIMLSQTASINGITYAYKGTGGFKQKAYTTRNPFDGCGPGLVLDLATNAFEPTYSSFDFALMDVSSAIRDERNFRGITDATANRYTSSGNRIPDNPEVACLQTMLPILSATTFVEPTTGMNVVYGIRSTEFVPATSITPEPVTLACTTAGYLTITTAAGQVLNCGTVQAPLPLTPGQSIKLRGTRAQCYKGINGTAKVISVILNTDTTETYLLNRLSCCGCAALACWTGWAWCVPDFLWAYAPYTYLDVSGVSKRSTGVNGLGVRRGRRRNRCCRPAPVSF